MLVDTDVLVWYMRGNSKALRAIEAREDLSISMVTYIELVQGLRNKSELNTLKSFLQSRSVPVLHVTESISSSAMFLVEQHHFSSSLGLADALIAATAMTHGLPLLTANAKHYRVVRNLTLRRFLP
jgi:hypothetical protein